MGVNVFVQDPLAVTFLFIAISNFRTSARVSPVLFVVVALVVTLGAIRTFEGASYFRLGLVAAEARPAIYLAAFVFWAGSVDWTLAERNRHVDRLVVVLGWGLTLVAAYHLARYGLGSSDSAVEASGLEQTGRILVAAQALALGIVALYLFDRWGRCGDRLALLSSSVFLIVVVLAQHRSVWVAIAIGLIAMLASSRGIQASRCLVWCVMAVWLGAIAYLTGTLGPVLNKLSASATNTQTLEGREGSLRALLEQSFDSGVATVLFGAPFGSGFRRVEALGRTVDYTPHNWYLFLYLRIGVVGILLVCAILLFASVLLVQERDVSGPLLLATLAYAWSYSLTWYSAAVIAYALISSRLIQPYFPRKPELGTPNVGVDQAILVPRTH